MTQDKVYDLAVIGGGINGCGIARDAAGRGLSVVLCEMGDLASATSSASTKLFHGGLRYLEYYEFRLVREALKERETLLRAMPHIAWPLRFVLPHQQGLRPAWLLRLGLFVYDHLGGRKILPATKTLDLRTSVTGSPLRDEFVKGFEYSDCWVQDSRLVALNARDAADRGAEIHTRTKCTSARREGNVWAVSLRNLDTGEVSVIRANGLVNAAGPWVEDVIQDKLALKTSDRIRLVRGSHVVVPKIFDHDRAYIFQNPDNRIIFAIPYEQDYTLIGTTDGEHDSPDTKPVCTPEEADYLCAAASEYFRKPITTDQILWTYSGVRPLYDDGAKSATAATRDYVLKVEAADGSPPLLSVFGGKITTYRRLAESALQKLKPHYPKMTAPWTAGAALAGGDFPVAEVAQRLDTLQKKYPFLDAPTATRLFRTYGTEVDAIYGGARVLDDLGHHFGAGLTEAEVLWLMDKEWARTAEDVLWRRTKLGLKLSKEQASKLDSWMQEKQT